ncbi:hypothetical protein ACLESD_27885 [Pyxidicoccus sp. 3LFB2]
MHGMRLAVIALAVGLAACGGGEDVPDVPREELGARVVEALCERWARCGVYASADACEQAMRLSGMDTYLGLGTRYDAALESGRLRYDEDAAADCLEALRDGACHVPALSEAAYRLGIEYDPACQVLQAEGSQESCQLHLECGANSYCDYSSSSDCEGTCKPRFKEGESATSRDQCAPGLVVGVRGYVCERPAREGEICFAQDGGTTRACLPGLWCDANGSGKCLSRGSEGKACGGQANPPCGESFVCKEGRCARRLREGAACTAPPSDSILITNECQTEFFCDGDAHAPGTCRVRLGEGGACRGFFACGEDLDCVGADPRTGERGLCQKLPGHGETCNAFEGGVSCARGLACSDASGTCVPSVRDGEPCGPEAVCSRGSCSDEGRCVLPEALTCH